MDAIGMITPGQAAHNAWCGEADWGKLDSEARDLWEDAAWAAIAAAPPASARPRNGGSQDNAMIGGPAASGWLPSRVMAFARARRALDENSIRDYEAGIYEETPEFLRLNRAVYEAKNGVPAWMQAFIGWVILRRLHYWDHVGHALRAAEPGREDRS